MPTPSMDLKGLSSPSYFSEDSCFLGQTQVRSCKSEFFPEQHGTNSRKPFDSPNFQKFTPSDHLEPFSLHDRELKLGLDQYSVQNAKSPADHPQLLMSLEHDPGSVAGISAAQASFADPRANGIVPPYENSLFSSSLPDLFSRKLKLSTRSTHFDKTMDTAPLHYDEEEPFTSIEEIESQTIGNLLPDDDDLLSGVTEGLDFVMPQPNGDDLEELDVFSNMGGMDLEDCDSSIIQRNINSGKDGSAVHNKQFSRILFVRNIDSNIDDSELQILFEQYGEVRNLYTACKQRGFIMISYYDIRAARKAMESLQNRSIRGRRLGIHYSNPKDNPTEQDTNQGILLVSNLDSSVSNDDLRSIFSAYGDIKEIQNVTQRNHQRLIQYFDTRAAEAALRTLNRSNIAGKQIKLDRFSSGRIKGFLQLSNELEQNSPSNHSLGFSGLPFRGISSSGMENGTPLGMKSSMRVPFIGSPIHHGTSSFAPDGLQSLLRVESGTPQGQSSFDVQESTNFHPHSLPEYPDGFINGIPSSPNLMGTNFGQWPPEVMDGRQLHRIGSNGHSLEQVYGSPGSSPISGHHLMWGNSSYRSQPPSGMMWQNSQSSYLNGLARLHSLPSSMLNTSTLNQTNNLHHVGSAPSVNPTALWDRQQQQQQQQQQPYAVGSPESSSFHPGSLGNMRFSKSSLHSVDFGPHMFPPHVGADPSKVIGLRSPHRMMFPGRGGQMVGPGLSLFDSPNERVRSRRHEGAASSQADKKQFELDVDRIIRGEDKRTTLMIKNIPNKYTSKMLLAAIDEFHRGTYDFIYLPIDFKNKCNVGYAFINMTDPTQIIPFYKAFNGKKWEKFNSEKVATLAYARIQGKSALIAHFQNSSLMNEDKRCRPILFHTEGPYAGDQIPFPMGVNVRSRPVKTRVSSFEENHQGAESSNRDSSTSPIRDSE